jgi:hypothetical protein
MTRRRRDSKPSSRWWPGPGPYSEGRLSCGFPVALMTGHACRGPAVSDAVRTQRGPLLQEHGWLQCCPVRRLLRRFGPPRPGTGSACRARSADSRLRERGGAGLLVCGWWPLGRVGEGPAALRAAGDDPADWRIASDTENSWKTHEFCVASASVLDMPRLWGSLRLCRVSCGGRWVALRLRRRLSICQEVTYHLLREASTSVGTAGA